MKINLVRAGEKDLDLLFKLESQCFEDFYSKEQILVDLKNDEQIFIFLAYLEDNLVGYVYYSIVLGEAELLRIAILQNYRNRGLSKIVLINSLDLLKDKIEKVFLEVSSKNEVAINLYQKIGFKNISLRKEYYRDRSDALIMFLDFMQQ